MSRQISDNSGKRQPTVATYPPLGLVTKLSNNIVKFSCSLNDETGNEDISWEVKFHYASIGSHEWAESRLRPSKASLFQPQRQGPAEGSLSVFGIDVTITTAIRFRLSFRRGPEESWFVAGTDSELESIVIPTLKDYPKKSLNINDYIHELNKELQSNLLDDGSKSGIVSWMVKAPVEAASGDSPYMTQVMFGKPFGGDFLRWFAISRNTTSWMAPRQGREYFKLDVAAITCSFINHQGVHLVFLGLSGFENTMAIFGDNNEGALMIKIRNEREAASHGRVIVAIGANLEATLNSTLDQARAVFASAGSPFGAEFHKQVEENWADQWINGLIYNPVNAFHQQQTEEEITETLESLSAKGITISGLVLSDFWQKVDQDRRSRFHAGLVDFDADPAAFKSGLKHAVAKIKTRNKSIRSVIVEHPIFGSWGGISDNDGPQGYFQKNYKTTYVQRSEAIQSNQKTVLKLPLVSAQDAQKFFDDYYKFLWSCDISAVRADGLYMLETLVSATDRCSLAEVYLDAQSLAAFRAFPSATLTTMSLSPSALLNNLKFPHRKVVRNIGVFPGPGRYVFNNAHNALLSNGIGNIPDWGSIQSTKDHGSFHAAARLISGGPIQIDSFDDLDTMNLKIFRGITASTARGKTVALRPNAAGRTMNPYVGFGDDILLKIANTHSVGTTAVSIIGIFNVSDRPISELLQLQDFLDIDPTKDYIVRSTCGTISDHLRLDSSVFISIDMNVLDYEFLCAYPLTTLTSPQSGDKVHVAVLGLQRKMLGAAAIINSNCSIEHDSLYLKSVLKGFGYLEIYISDLAQRSIDERTCRIQVQGRTFAPSTGIINVEDRLMILDLESIWEEQDLETSTDEIYVEVTLYPS